jgi:hypothetical protein
MMDGQRHIPAKLTSSTKLHKDLSWAHGSHLHNTLETFSEKYWKEAQYHYRTRDDIQALGLEMADIRLARLQEQWL